METREMSESKATIENDVTLTAAESSQESAVNEIIEAPQEELAAAPASAPAVSEEPAAENEAPAPADEAADEAVAPGRYLEMEREQLVEVLEKLAQLPMEEIKDEVPLVRAALFVKRKEMIAAEKEQWIAAGNDEEQFAVSDDEIENRVKELLGAIKDKRAEYHAKLEAERAANLDKKKAVIEQINAITADPDNINRHFGRVQQLQQEFKEIGAVPATDETDVWKAYQQAVEKFYDLLKINKELRDYDFKKNLEIKQQLCLEAEELDDVEDIVDAFHRLQKLHATWRETGPVAKEIREELWARFKSASSAINKKYQAFFEERKGKEQENADAKTALCEQIEAISTEGLKTYAAWDEATKVIIGLQEQWKQLGFASRKVNTSLFTRFRKSCDEFFAQKAAFFKRTKDELAANLAQKTALCEKAEALKDSTDWRKTTEELVALQKEWRSIGPVVKKHSDAIWKRFIAACDYFFEQKKKRSSSVHAVEHENLKAKKEVIAQLKAIVEAEDAPDDAPQAVRDLMAKWQEIGHVPFKEKDKIYAEYRALVDKAFEQLDMRGSRARMAHFESSINQMAGSDKISHEREKLLRAYEQRVNDLKTYENNLGFFNAQSKTGNSLVKEMERKIEKLKEEIAQLEQKIKLIDEKM